MTDQAVIQQAYEAKLADLYDHLFQSFAMAGPSAPDQAAAVAAFKAGVTLARAVREAALAQL